MNDPDIRAIIENSSRNDQSRIPMLRDKLIAKVLRIEAEQAHPGAEVLDNIKIYEKIPEANVDEWQAKHPGRPPQGLTDRTEGLYLERGEIDMMVIERQASGKAKLLAREEIKTGARDRHADAQNQLDDQSELLSAAATGKRAIRLELGGREITAELDLASDATASKSTRGPAGKKFDKSLGISAADLEVLCKELLANGATAAGGGQ